jgi:hypothetical protein
MVRTGNPRERSGVQLFVRRAGLLIIAIYVASACGESDARPDASIASPPTTAVVTSSAPSVLPASVAPAVSAESPDPDVPEAPLLEPSERQSIVIGTHCGVGILSTSVNGRWWRTDEAPEEGDWIPAEWSSPTSASGLQVELMLSADGHTLIVTYNDRAVVYVPTELRETDLCA